MNLFRDLLLETLSAPGLMNRELDRHTFLKYLETHLSVERPVTAYYVVTLPVSDSVVSVYGRRAATGEVVFVVDLGDGTREPLILGKDGGVIFTKLGRD